ncbi:hypothetical protein DS832_04500 [Bombilactobacillus bombi]|uniref:Competence protein CoiA nuclease-like domain-containing protein n=1 Tax=Bombilactobacillus bombi TaxID=1303590 RepID=A0A3R6VH09_9LACO|nr:hypothetical protein DS832_04500 [Bombilactobacillus bombi]
MLSAYNQKGKLIYAIQNPAHELFFCPKCKRPVQLIKGVKRPYFRHIGSKTITAPESSLHLAGKHWLAQFFASFFVVDLEYVWDVEQRLDLYARNQRWQFAIEYQCSPISKKELQRRNQLYVQKGLKPLWIFGPQHYQQALKLRHLQNIVSYSSSWGFYVLFKLPQDDFLRLNHHYQSSPYSNKLYWQQAKIENWQQLSHLKPKSPSYPVHTIDWQQWYQFQQLHPQQNFIALQNWCYQHQCSLLFFIKKTPPITMFPIYRYWPCYLTILKLMDTNVVADLPLISESVIQACVTADQAKFDNLF